MKKNLALILALLAGVAIGAVAVIYNPRSGAPSQGANFAWPAEKEEPGLSRLLFSGEYVKAKSSVELRFENGVAFVDGSVFGGENLQAELLKKKEQKKARFLTIIADDSDRFGSLVERVSALRKLGFDYVVLMTNHVWAYDDTSHSWKRTR